MLWSAAVPSYRRSPTRPGPVAKRWGGREAAGGGRGAPRNRIPWGEGLRPAPPRTYELRAPSRRAPR